MKSVDEVLDQVERKVMLVVMPHPDDETVMMGGLIIRVVSMGWRVVVVCLTKGERGRLYCYGWGRSLAEIREMELARAVRILTSKDSINPQKRVSRMTEKEPLVLLNYPDGGLRENMEWVEEVEKIVKGVKPGLVVTYEPSGLSGHPDHVVVSREVFSIVKKYRKTQLLWVGLEKGLARKFVDEEVWKVMLKPEYKLEMSLGEVMRKSMAILAHWCQGLWTKPKLWALFWYYRTEYYSLADMNQEYEWEFFEYRI